MQREISRKNTATNPYVRGYNGSPTETAMI